VADRNQGGLKGQMKTQGNWAVECGWRPHRIEVAGDICWRRPRPTEGCRSDDGDTIRTNTELIRGSILACKATNKGHKHLYKTNILSSPLFVPINAQKLF